MKLTTTTTLVIAVLVAMAKAEFDCGKHCMQCLGKYNRGYCTMCNGAKNYFGRCSDKAEDHCQTYTDVRYGDRSLCLRCEPGYQMRTDAYTRTCHKITKEEEKKKAQCLIQYRWGDDWHCQLCKGGIPHFERREHGRCVDFPDHKIFDNCAEGSYTYDGWRGCYRCKKGYSLNYNSRWTSWRHYTHPYCEKWEGNRKGCLTFNVLTNNCEVCDVQNGYHKRTVFERGCVKHKK